MFDARTFGRAQRSEGMAHAGLRLSCGATRLATLRQSGSAKAILPRVAGTVPEVVFLNTSGGLTGGDRLAYGLNVGKGAEVVATTQTAERAYASDGPEAAVSVRASVGAGGRLDWLPQETILFEHCDLDRTTEIDLAGDAACLLTEAVILGRHAMGEAPVRARLTDGRVVRRDGRVIWAETIRIDAGLLAEATAPAILGLARAFAVIALIAPGAADAVGPLRAVLDEPGTEAAASGWDGKCVARIVARDGWPLKRQIARALGALRSGPLPRVWQMQGLAA
mgnify:FL=1